MHIAGGTYPTEIFVERHHGAIDVEYFSSGDHRLERLACPNFLFTEKTDSPLEFFLRYFIHFVRNHWRSFIDRPAHDLLKHVASILSARVVVIFVCFIVVDQSVLEISVCKGLLSFWRSPLRW